MSFKLFKSYLGQTLVNMKENLPIILCTSVIRSSQQGESHGGMYLVNLETEKFHQVVDWNDQAIDWHGRGADRGLRGLAFFNDWILAAASDEVFVYDQQFNIIKSFRNHYLKHCHEICVHDNILYISSTGYDSILLFDLLKETFIKGYCFRKNSSVGLGPLPKILERITGEKTGFSVFDPSGSEGPAPGDTTHINNVVFRDGSIYFSGTKMSSFMEINGDGKLNDYAIVPKGTHNVQFYADKLIMNNTGNDTVLMNDKSGQQAKSYEIMRYAADELLNTNLPNDHARQGFGRGLCTFGEFIVAGSSPATISIYHVNSHTPLKFVSLTKDIRNAIHGLEIYPYPSASNFV